MTTGWIYVNGQMNARGTHKFGMLCRARACFMRLSALDICFQDVVSLLKNTFRVGIGNGLLQWPGLAKFGTGRRKCLLFVSCASDVCLHPSSCLSLVKIRKTGQQSLVPNVRAFRKSVLRLRIQDLFWTCKGWYPMHRNALRLIASDNARSD